MKIRKYDLPGNIGPGNTRPTLLNGTVQLELGRPHVLHLLPGSPQSLPFPLVPPTQRLGVSCSRELTRLFLL